MLKKQMSVLLILLLLFSAIGCGASKNRAETTKRAIGGYVDTEGNGYLPTQDGTVQKISGDISSILITEDRQHIIFLEKDGALNILSGSEKKNVDENVRSIDSLSNDSVLYSKLKNKGKYYPPNDYSYENYSDNEYSYFYYSFLTGNVISLTNCTYERTSAKSGFVLYSTYNEDTERYALNRITTSSVEPESLLSSSKALYPIGLSEDGSMYAWLEMIDDGANVYLSVNGEKEKAFSLDKAEYPHSFYLRFNKKQDFAVISSYFCDKAAIWTKENGISKATLPNELQYNTPYTDVGSMIDYPDVDAGAIYLATDEDANLKNIYSVTPDGTREKLVSNVTTFNVRNGNMYYITENGALYIAHAEKGLLSDEKKLAEDVCDFTISPDGSAVAFAKDVSSDNIGAIYYYQNKMEKPVRVVAEGYCYAYYSTYSKYWMYNIGACFSNDGTKLFYFTDPYENKGSNIDTGTLYVYDVSSKESVRIGSDIQITFSSEYIGNYPAANGIWYLKYLNYESGTGSICELMYWNGETAIKLASDIVQ